MRSFSLIVLLCLLAAPAAARDIRIPALMAGAGEVAVLRTAADYRFMAEDLFPFVAANMNADMQRAFQCLTAPDGRVTPSQMPLAGIEMRYDETQSLFVIRPDPAQMRARQTAVRAPQVPTGAVVVPPANLSAFANLRAGQDIVYNSAANDGRQPLRLDIDGAVNLRGTVLETRVDYLEDAARPWQRQETRLVRDLPDKMVRLAAGDLSYPVTGFQAYRPMLGVSVARNFTLQPYRVTAPSGDMSFVLRSPSRVDILVNGQRVRSLRLEPGTYNVADFPVTDGSNDVELVITDSAGNVERKTFSLLSDQTLLQKGLHEYAYNIGIESRFNNRRIDYSGDPAFSGFHRIGLSDEMTAGLSAQAGRGAQQAGAQVLRVFPFGTVGADLAVSHAQGHGEGAAAQLGYRYTDRETRHDFSMMFTWRSPDFAALSDGPPANPAAFETVFRYNMPLLDLANVGFGGRYRFGRGAAEDDWSYALNASRNLTSEVYMTFTAEHRRRDGAGVFVGFVYQPPLSRHSVSASADTLADVQDLEWRYRADRDVGAFSAAAGITRDGNSTRLTGDAAYAGYRAEGSVRHDITRRQTGGGEDQRTSLLLGTALVFADGHAALSRPVNGGFVIMPRHKNLGGHVVGVNPRAEDDYQARADAFGPAVVQGITPYMYRSLRIDPRGIPAGYDLGPEHYAVMPAYKGGSLLTIGHGANIFADGHVYLPDGASAALQGGDIVPLAAGGAKPQEFFTNAQGRVRIAGLAAGRYRVTLHRYPRMVAELAVPDMPAGRFAAGEIRMAEVLP